MNLQKVEKGDTAASFAARYNLTPKRLKELNPGQDKAISASLAGSNDRVLRNVARLKVPPTVAVTSGQSAATFVDGVRKGECDLKGLGQQQGVDKLIELNPSHKLEIERSMGETAKVDELDKKPPPPLQYALRGKSVKVPDKALDLTPKGLQGKQKTVPKQTMKVCLDNYGVDLDAFKTANAATIENVDQVTELTRFEELKLLPAGSVVVKMPSPRRFKANDTIDSFRLRNNVTVEELVAANPTLMFRLHVAEDETRLIEKESAVSFASKEHLGAEALKSLNENFRAQLDASEKLVAAQNKAVASAQKASTLRGIAFFMVAATPVEKDVEPGWTIDQAAEEFGVTIQALIDANPEPDIHAELVRASTATDGTLLAPAGDPAQLEVGGESVQPAPKNTVLSDAFLGTMKTTLARLKELNDAIADRLIPGKYVPNVPRLVTDLLAIPRIEYSNDGFEWLTYETVCNNPQFRRTNQPIKLPLYSVEMNDMDLWLREGIEGPLLKSLCEAFSPDLESWNTEIVSTYSWPWKNEQYLRAETAIEHGRRAGSRGAQMLTLEPRLVLPYNPYDNHDKSLALGTTRTSDSMNRLVDGAPGWTMWRTASRSCIVELKKVKEVDDDWDPLLDPAQPAADAPFEWPWSAGADIRKLVETKETFEGEIAKGSRFKLADLASRHVSLKTGVCYVGSRDQSWEALKGDGKDAIDGNWIVSCLRSDLVALTDELMKDRAADLDPAKRPLLVLTELLTIAEKKDRTNHVATKQFRDGMQVRDLSPLRTDRTYVFPGSIPFLGTDNKTLGKTWYESRNNLAWREFWRDAWAVGLGDAKARFLLRYGLQHKNPNPQNYLIEVEAEGGALKLPARIVIRDLQDAAIHRETMWAFYGKPEAPPVQTDASAGAELAAAFKGAAERLKGTEKQLVRTLQYEFEHVPWDQTQETGSVEQDFGGPGVQLAWWSFSTGPTMNQRTGLKPDKTGAFDLIVKDLGEDGLAEVKEMLGQWGLAHNASLVRRYESELGIEIRTIDWKRFPAHKRFPEGYVLSTQEKADVGHDTDIDLAGTQELQKVLAGEDGRKKMADYRARGWKAATPAKTWTVVGHDGKPVPWSTILFECGSADAPTRWSRPTAGDGTMPLFDGQPVAERAWLHTYDNSITKLVLEGSTWKPVDGLPVRVNFVISDGKGGKVPISDPALQATWSAAAGGSRPTGRAPTDGTVLSDLLSPGFHKLKAVCDGGRQSKFGFLGDVAWDLALETGKEIQPFTVEVERLYTHVRCVAHCLLTVARQLFTPKPTALEPDAGEWQAEYVGLPVETEDIEARVAFLKKAIDKAADAVGDDDPHELKVYIVPECFFLGPYGAYQAANIDLLVGKLQELVKEERWRNWLFVFGTVNGTYEEELSPTAVNAELFNVSPVIRGGGGQNGPDYTKLLQKTFFSSEMPGMKMLKAPEDIPQGSGATPTADSQTPPRTSKALTEEAVRSGFGATENEAILAGYLRDLLKAPTLPQPVEAKPINPWDQGHWDRMKREIQAKLTDERYGMTEVVREVRRFSAGDPEKQGFSFTPNLASLLQQYVSETGTQDVELATPGGASGGSKKFAFGDFAFRCARKPGPILELDADVDAKNKVREVAQESPAKKLPPDQILTFGLEICADHSQGRVKYAEGATPVDIHLLPSAGMGLGVDRIAARDQGYALNCDGWNAVGVVLKELEARGAQIDAFRFVGRPDHPGSNPLNPHSELLKNSGGKYEAVTAGKLVSVREDVKAIFAEGSGFLHVYPSQELPQ